MDVLEIVAVPPSARSSFHPPSAGRRASALGSNGARSWRAVVISLMRVSSGTVDPPRRPDVGHRRFQRRAGFAPRSTTRRGCRPGAPAGHHRPGSPARGRSSRRAGGRPGAARRRLRRRPRQAASRGPVNSVSPGPIRSSVETRPSAVGTQWCAMRPPRSTWSSSPGRRREPVVGRAGDVVLGDRPALGLVGVEQLRAGPAPQHPAELPAEVEAAVDRGVHAGAAARGHPVGGVAHQERRVPRGSGRRSARRGERADPLDPRREVGHAGREPDQLRSARSWARAGSLAPGAATYRSTSGRPVPPAGRRSRRPGAPIA